MVVLEVHAHHFPVRHGQAPLPKRRVRIDVLGLLPHAPVGVGVLLADLGKFGDGALRVAPLRHVRAIEKRHVKHWIGNDVFEPVVGERVSLS
jgi:hypothetical protein